MENRMNKLRTTLNRLSIKACLAAREAKEKLREESGQFVMDHAVVFVSIIVLGGVALILLRNYLESDLSNTLKDKINEFFN